jgi:ABC-type multidrug transport system permease subunit
VRASNILHLGVKELRSLARDPVMLLLILWGFAAAIYAAATVMPETLNRAAIGIVDEDWSPLSTRISGAFYPPYFNPPALISQQEMDARMDVGDDTFALDIPPNFQRDLLAGRPPTIQLNVDATRMSQAYVGSGYVQTIVFAGTIARSMPQFGLLFMITMIPLLMLSGGLTPRESMPDVVRTVMLAAPTTHFVMLAQGILYRGAGLDVVWRQFAILFAIGAVLFACALARFRATIGTMA